MGVQGYQYSQGRSRILSANYGTPLLGAGTAVHAAVTDTGVDQVVTTGLTNPDVPRNITATAGGTAADVKAVQVVITGTNTHGDVITETLPAFTVNTTGTVTGSKAFATVTSVTIPAHDGTGATTAIGTGSKLGLPVKFSRKTFVNLFVADAVDTIAASTVSATAVESNTFTTTTALDGSKSVVFDYYK
ncbi:hypothetical protein [Streptomyces sp. NPDC048211]|uniref:hypothetical protein n=1 Tax=Streptomyces sp. NPDC048211 TaxID=3365516 RepID=UPI00371E0953